MKEFENNQTIGLNINEIRVNQELIDDKDLLSSYMFECQCAIFLVDITSGESFTLSKNLIEKIEEIISNENEENKKTNNLKNILVINKIDLESQRKVTKDEISSLLTEIATLDSIEISLKEYKSIPELESKIIKAYEKKPDNKLGTDLIYEQEEEKANIQNSLYMKAESTINCIIIGETEVGKSCFLMRYYRNQFSDSFLATVGIDKETKIIKIKDTLYRLTLWDTAGQERFRSITTSYYKSSQGLILMYDITKRESFDNVENWLQNIKESIGDEKYVIVLLGNKLDLVESDPSSRTVKTEEAESLCKDKNIFWGGECSAKDFTEEQLKDIFTNYTQEIYKKVGVNIAKGQLVTKHEKNKKSKC
jgi:Ras-related protein Rab-1A